MAWQKTGLRREERTAGKTAGRQRKFQEEKGWFILWERGLEPLISSQ